LIDYIPGKNMTNTQLLLSTMTMGLLFCATVAGQTAEIMDRIIATPSISVSQAAYLVFVASGKLAEDASPDQAFTLFQEMNWVDAHGDPDRPLRAAEYAFLLTKSYGLQGGFLGELLPSPRYAYRDLVFRGLFAARGDPEETLTGVEAVRILGKVMDSLPQGGRS